MKVFYFAQYFTSYSYPEFWEVNGTKNKEFKFKKKKKLFIRNNLLTLEFLKNMFGCILIKPIRFRPAIL
jgi:hypothetical protein